MEKRKEARQIQDTNKVAKVAVFLIWTRRLTDSVLLRCKKGLPCKDRDQGTGMAPRRLWMNRRAAVESWYIVLYWYSHAFWRVIALIKTFQRRFVIYSNTVHIHDPAIGFRGSIGNQCRHQLNALITPRALDYPHYLAAGGWWSFLIDYGWQKRKHLIWHAPLLNWISGNEFSQHSVLSKPSVLYLD